MKDAVDQALKNFSSRNFTNAKRILENFDCVTDQEAMFALGEIYYCGLAGSTCREIGLKYFRIAAALGSTNAMLRLAGELEMDARNHNEVENFLLLASQKGSFNARKRLGFYALNRSGYNQNQIILRAAKHGNVECMLEYALRVQRGQEVPDFIGGGGFFQERKAKQQAVSECLDHWYTKAASAGNVDVIRYLFTGWGPDPGTQKLVGVPANCRRELERAADNGEALALAVIGFAMLYRRNEFYQDLSRESAIQRATLYLLNSARKDNAFAAGQLAWEFSSGRNVTPNDEIALAFVFAAKNMDPDYSPDVEGRNDVMLLDLERRVNLDRLESIRQSPWSFIKF